MLVVGTGMMTSESWVDDHCEDTDTEGDTKDDDDDGCEDDERTIYI